MTAKDPTQVILDDSGILATHGGIADKVLNTSATDAPRVLYSKAVPGQQPPSGRPGVPALGSKISEGSYLLPNTIGPNDFITTKRQSYTVHLGKERKHPTRRRRFDTKYQARAEAAAGTTTNVVVFGAGGYWVFETNKPKYFIPSNVQGWRSPGWDRIINSAYDFESPGVSYTSAVQKLKAATDKMKAKVIADILQRFFEFGPGDLHRVTSDDYIPGKLNIDASLVDAGLARFTGPTGQNASPSFARKGSLPRPSFAIGRNAFDLRSRLKTWEVIVHEEFHTRLIRDAIRLWRAWRASSSKATFFTWLAGLHATKSLAGTVYVSDDYWLMIREAGRDLLYQNAQHLHLSEVLGAFEGFTSVFHNLPLAAFRTQAGSLMNTVVFSSLSSAEVHWRASTWDAQVPGLSGRVLQRWADYVTSLSPTYKQEVKTYLLTHAVGPTDEFHPALRKALGW